MYLPSIFNTHNFYVPQRGIQYQSVYVHANIDDYARGDGSVAHKSELIEILEFTHFFEHFTFDKTDYSERGKHMKKYIRVVVAVELVTVGAKIEPTS